MIQHLLWFLGHPETLFQAGVWGLALIGALKLGRRLWKNAPRYLSMGYFVGILAFIAGYSWLFLRAQNAIASGGYDTRVFYILNSVNLLLLVFAAFTLAWIVRDRFSQKSQGNS